MYDILANSTQLSDTLLSGLAIRAGQIVDSIFGRNDLAAATKESNVILD